MPDAIFADPRLAVLYDAFDGRREDLTAYLALAEELGAATVLDVGCGTGALALLLAERGIAVTAVDPAAASLDVARAKPGATQVTWIDGDAGSLPPLQVDLAVMTANVAQVFLTDEAWSATLRGVRRALRPGGHLVLETRVPADRAWERWTPEATRQRTDLDGTAVETWTEVVAVELPLVTFRHRFVFGPGDEVVSDSTLRFRELDELDRDLRGSGLGLVDVRDAPDRPGREYVVVARRD